MLRRRTSEACGQLLCAEEVYPCDEAITLLPSHHPVHATRQELPQHDSGKGGEATAWSAAILVPGSHSALVVSHRSTVPKTWSQKVLVIPKPLRDRVAGAG